MKAAIYARRSTTEHQATSLDVQVEEARRWCAARGWEVVSEYREDGVSRADFANRPALGKLLADAERELFGAVVMRDETRLGGDLYRTGALLQELHDQRVEVWHYATNERVSFDSPELKLMSAVRLYAAEVERLKLSGRVREGLENRARRGLNVGGRVYGYDNERTPDGVRYVINADQADVVRWIFGEAAAGRGLRSIARALNGRGVPPPRAGRRGTGSWSPSCVRAILRRPRYRGLLEWGRLGGEYRGGQRRVVERPEGERVRVEAPELAIVSADLWERAQTGGEAWAPSTRRGPEPGYLLTGVARCGACGGPIHASSGKVGGVITRLYVCGYHKDRGKAACAVSTRRPVEDVDAAFLRAIRERVLSPAVVDAVLDGVRRALSEGDVPDTSVAELHAQQARLRAECARLADAYAASGSEALLSALRTRETAAAEVARRLDVLAAVEPSAGPTWAEIEPALRAEVEELTALLGGAVADARRAVRSLLAGPLVFVSVADGVRKTKGTAWELRANLKIPGSAPLCMTPTGIEQWGTIPLTVAA